MSIFNKSAFLLLHQQTSLVSSELGTWRRRWVGGRRDAGLLVRDYCPS